jgi:AcrR family transcriptional regulator
MTVSPESIPPHGAEPHANGERPAPRRTAAERSREVTRERLLASGRALFARDGLHGVTSHAIAHEAGVAAGTFYLHFSDKGALFREIAGQTVAALRARLDAVRTEGLGVEESVRAHAQAMVSFSEDNRDLMRILFSGDVEAAAVEQDVLNELAASVAEVRRQRSDAGQLAQGLDPAVLSQALVGMWARVLAWWTEDPSRAPGERVVETLTRIQLAGTDPV